MKPQDNNLGSDLPKDFGEKVEPDYDLDNATYFGYTEKPFFERMSQGRYTAFYPLLVILRAMGVRPNHLTGLAFFSVLVGFPALFFFGQPHWAFGLLAFNIILDGLDGPLAKLEQEQPRSGAFWDMGNDVTSMVVVLVTCAHYQLLHPTAAFIYVAAYLYLTFTAVALNVLRMPFRFVTKTKYPVYVFLLIRSFSGPDITTWFCLAMVGVMAIHLTFSAYRIAKKLDEKK
jgi:phosphatidylglycerophosphate synthase